MSTKIYFSLQVYAHVLFCREKESLIREQVNCTAELEMRK